MPILATGNQLATDVTFNSGTLDINGLELAALQDITITASVTEKEIRGLGTIKMLTAPKRATWKPGAKAKTKSFNRDLFTMFMGSSGTDGSGQAITLLDGQNVLTRCSIKCIVNEATGQAIEFQFTNAILSGALQAALKMEDAGEMDLEIVAQDMTIVTSSNF